MLDTAVLIFFPILMAFAGCSDLFTMLISNRISIALAVGFLPLAVLVGLPTEQLLLHYSCGAAILVITFSMFCFGWVGGGDAKLAAATAIWVGWEHMMEYALLTAVLGGILTLLLLLVRRWPLPGLLIRQTWIARLHDEKTGIPYGIALAVAGLLIYPETAIWLRSISA